MADGTPIIIKKKKVHGGHGHHGGSWKVAYADFVTAMMAFFMVMWIMGLSEETKAKIQTYFQDPFSLPKKVPHADSALQLGVPQMPKPGHDSGKDTPRAHEENKLANLQKEIKDKVQSDPSLKALFKHLETELTSQGLRVEMVESTDAEFFHSGSAVLSDPARRLISRIAPLLEKAAHPIVVEGHTDSAPYVSKTYNNWDLSSDRANALRRALSIGGVESHYFRGISGLADTQLKYPNNPLDPRNRRVTILLPYQAPKEASIDLPKDQLETQLHQEIEPGITPPGATAPTTASTDSTSGAKAPTNQAAKAVAIAHPSGATSKAPPEKSH
jgi:chemotaxis protein MotB